MSNVTDNFKIDIRTYGRQIDVKMKVNDVDFDSDNLNYIKPSFNTDLFKTIMHQVEIDSKIAMSKDTKINIKVGIKVNEQKYEYISFNTYYVKTCERQEDTNSYRIIAYTKIKDSMIDYDLNITKELTVREYLVRIFQRLGWNTSNIPTSFINSNKTVNPLLHTGINYTFRDTLDEITTITCSFIYFDEEDRPCFTYLKNTNESIDESYLDEDNINVGEKYFINSLVFSRAEESDNIYRKDNESIEINGLHEFKISDCQLLSTNNRDIYIDEMFDYLKTLEFYIFDIQSKGILFLKVCDIFNLTLNGTSYPVILLNDEISIENGLTEKLYFDEPEETETEYRYADVTDKRINQTTLIVDKQKQQIEALITNNTEISQKTAQLEMSVEQLQSQIGDVADITTTVDGYGKITAENINKSEPIMLKIHPVVYDITSLKPEIALYPRVRLYPHSREIYFKNTTTKETIIYNIPCDLYVLDDVYDEFVLDYANNDCYVVHNIEIVNGTKQKKEIPTTEKFTYPTIDLTNGDYIITIPSSETAYIYTRLMVQNIYTDQFATKVEVNTKITQTSTSIKAEVNKTLESYPTNQEMKSAIEMQADKITSSVSNSYTTKTETANAKEELEDSINNVKTDTDNKLKNYVTTVEMNSAITQKEDEITTSVSKNISTAKQEAINSSNTSTDNKLKNYSTTTQMNSAIKQKADEISSSVSTTYITKTDSATNIANAKTEAVNSANTSTDNKLKNYSTTTQMNSAITQKANEITSTVESKITTEVNNINIGGRNLVLNSDAYIETSSTTNTSKAFQFNVEEFNELAGKQIVMSMDIELTNAIYNSSATANKRRIVAELSIVYADGTTQYCDLAYNLSSTAETIKKRISAVIQINNKEIKQVTAKTIGIYVQGLGSGTVKAGRLKVELGNKATDWTPASEDYSTTSEMNSKISQTAEEINSTVSKKIIEAQDEAIDIANTTTDSRLLDFATTTEMNSAITQKANEINLEVSKKVGNNEIISKINQSSEKITIDASKISLKRKRN